MFEEQCAVEADDRRVIREDTDDIGPAFNFGVEPFEWILRSDLLAMRAREIHERRHVAFGLVKQRSQLWHLRTKVVGDLRT